MLKLLFIVVLVYFVIRAARNLIVAVLEDRSAGRNLDHGSSNSPAQPERRPSRESARGKDIEDAVWEDLP